MDTSIKSFSRPIAALRGARNPHVFLHTFRFLRSVRLALHPAKSFSGGIQ